MNCIQAKHAIHQKLDGELSPTGAASLALHCAACHDCRAFASEFGAIDEALGELRSATANVGASPKAARTPPPPWTHTLARVAAAVTLLVGAGAITYRAAVERDMPQVSVSPAPSPPVTPDRDAPVREVQVALSADSADRFIPVAQASDRHNVHLYVLFERP